MLINSHTIWLWLELVHVTLSLLCLTQLFKFCFSFLCESHIPALCLITYVHCILLQIFPCCACNSWFIWKHTIGNLFDSYDVTWIENGLQTWASDVFLMWIEIQLTWNDNCCFIFLKEKNSLFLDSCHGDICKHCGECVRIKTVEETNFHEQINNFFNFINIPSWACCIIRPKIYISSRVVLTEKIQGFELRVHVNSPR